ncbi:MAG: serine/threonine protein kinase [Deltaproteobacteria bacterium]|nr:serine/threonine protein kinase [Deltaproteobacteria bacterium]
MTIADDQRVGSSIAEKLRVEHVVDARSSSLLLLATDQYTGARVLVHVVRPQLTHDQDAVRLMLEDARSASTIGHPNIANVTELGFDTDGGVFMVLEPMNGETLTGLFTRAGGALGPQYGVDLLLPIVGAMGAVHRQGHVHGDIRPENVFLTYDAAGKATAKLFGFGLARVHDAYARRAGPGQIAGNPYYMSPEETRGETGGPASDVWSLGVILYQAVSGRLPFDAQDPASMIQAVNGTAARPLLHVAPQTPAAIAQAIDRALIADRAVRYSDMTQMHAALAAAVSPPAPKPASTPPPSPSAGVVPTTLDGDTPEPVGDPLASTVAAEPPSGAVMLPESIARGQTPPSPPAPALSAGAKPATPSFPHAAPPPRPAPGAQNPAAMARTMEMTPQEAETLRALQSQAMSLSTPPSVRPPSGQIATAAPAVVAAAWPPASTPAPPMPAPAKKSNTALIVVALLALFVVLGGVGGFAAWWFVIRANEETGEVPSAADAGAIVAPTPPVPPPVSTTPAVASDDAGTAQLDDAGIAAPAVEPPVLDAGPSEPPPPSADTPPPSADTPPPSADTPAAEADAGAAVEEPDDDPRRPGRRPTKRRPGRGGPLIRRTW